MSAGNHDDTPLAGLLLPGLPLHDLVGLARDPIADARQSNRAGDIQRGTCRLLQASGWAPLPEVTLANGRRADILALSKTGEIWIVEIKSSLADFRSDTKWEEYLTDCDRFSFAVGADFPTDVLPDEWGLIVADRFGAEVVRDTPGSDQQNRLSAARRKAVGLRFARQAALRLRTLHDPDTHC